MTIHALLVCLALVAALLGNKSPATAQNGLADLLEQVPPESPSASMAASTSVGEGSRLPIPSQGSIDQSTRRIEEIFSARISKARTQEDKSALAGELLRNARETAEPADKFALLAMARELAVDGGNPDIAFLCTGEAGKTFFIDPHDAEQRVAEELVTKTPPDKIHSVIDRLLRIAAVRLDDGKFEASEKAAQSAVTAAKRSKNRDVQAKATGILTEIRAAKKAKEREQSLRDALASSPEDPTKAEILGRFLCFENEEWDEGLRYLIRGTDSALIALARLDAAPATEPSASLNKGDAWWDYANKQKGDVRQAAESRARFHYDQALANLKGLDRARVEQRLAERGSASGGGGPWLVIFRSKDPAVWNTDSSNDRDNFAVLLAKVPSDIRYARLRAGGRPEVIFAIRKHQLGTTFIGERYGWAGDKHTEWGVIPLGVFDRQMNVRNMLGHVGISSPWDKNYAYSGWGFGVEVHKNGTVAMCWNGSQIPVDSLEIAVSRSPLSVGESKRLLKDQP